MNLNLIAPWVEVIGVNSYRHVEGSAHALTNLAIPDTLDRIDVDPSILP